MANLNSLSRIAPLYINMRTGQSGDPFRDMDETKKIPPSGFMVLTEIPSEINRVKISGYIEVKQNAHMSAKKFIVDYDRGIIMFHDSDIGRTVRMIYSGAGLVALSADRIFTKDDGDKPIEYLSDAINGYKEVAGNVNKMNKDVNNLINRINIAVVDSEATLGELEIGLAKVKPQMEELSKLVSESRYNNAKVGEMINKVEGIDESLDRAQRTIRTAERALENAKLTQDNMASMQVEILQKVQSAESQMKNYMADTTKKMDASLLKVDNAIKDANSVSESILKVQKEIVAFKEQSKKDVDKMISDGNLQLTSNLTENTKKVDAKIAQYTATVIDSKKLVEDGNKKLNDKLIEVDGIVAGVVANNKKELAEMITVNNARVTSMVDENNKKINSMIDSNNSKIDTMIQDEIARTTELISKTQLEVNEIQEDAKAKIIAHIKEGQSQIDKMETDTKKKVEDYIDEVSERLNRIADAGNKQASRIENIKFAGEYDKDSEYKAGNIIHYNRDAFIATKDIDSNNPPIVNDGWSKFASGGVDGDGSVSSVNGIKPSEDGDVSLGDISWDSLAGIPKPLTNLEESEDGALTYKGSPIGKQTSVHRDIYVADGESKKFELTNSYEVGANATTVYLNGVVQFAGINYSEVDGAIEFPNAPRKDSLVAVVYHELLNTVNVKVDGIKGVKGVQADGAGIVDLDALIRRIVQEELNK